MLVGKKHSESDSLLLQEMRSGSRDAFHRLYEKYRSDVYAEANKRLLNPDLAKDITQEVFLGFWQNGTRKQIDNLPGYLFISVRNKVLRTIEQQDRFIPFTDLLNELYASKEHPDHRIRYKELLQAYEQLINHLPEQQRIIYKMRFVDNLTPEEIAVQLNLSPKTVRNHLGKAILRLKTIFMLLQILMLSVRE